MVREIENETKNSEEFLNRLGMLALARMICKKDDFKKGLQEANYYFDHVTDGKNKINSMT